MASDSLHADSRSARHSGHLPSHAGAHTAGTHSHMGGAVRTGAASGTAGGACGTGTLGGLCAAENGMAGGCHTGKRLLPDLQAFCRTHRGFRCCHMEELPQILEEIAPAQK